MSELQIAGTGYALPQTCLSNTDLESFLDTSDAWIRQRTGIENRHIAFSETTSDLALEAARKALADAAMDPQQVDLILVATVSPDHFTPSCACRVQKELGIEEAVAFDVNAACSGFLFALHTASRLLEDGQTALIIGAETLSRIVDWTDRSSAVLFGDGAGAVVVSKTGTAPFTTWLQTRPDEADVLLAPAFESLSPQLKREPAGFLAMKGAEVFRFAVQALSASLKKGLEQQGWDLADLDLIIPHQANLRIIQSAARSLNLEAERFFTNLAEVGNMSAASLPVALAQAAQNGRLQPGMHIALIGFGAGLSLGAACFTWQKETL